MTDCCQKTPEILNNTRQGFKQNLHCSMETDDDHFDHVASM